MALSVCMLTVNIHKNIFAHEVLLNISQVSVLDACDVKEHLDIYTFSLPS